MSRIIHNITLENPPPTCFGPRGARRVRLTRYIDNLPPGKQVQSIMLAKYFGFRNAFSVGRLLYQRDDLKHINGRYGIWEKI